MIYFEVVVAIGIIALYVYWARDRKIKLSKKQKSKEHPRSNAKRHTELRRIK